MSPPTPAPAPAALHLTRETTAAAPPRHFPSIDILRGVAALSVVVYHLWLRYFPGQSTQTQAFKLSAEHPLSFWLTLPIQYGYVGVTLFFVISGFCIHLPHARRFNANGDDGLRPLPFAKQRFRRLYPAYFASIIFTSIAMALFPLILAISKGTMPNLAKTFGLSDAVGSMAFLLPFGLAGEGFNGVYWTLIFEVQFYAAYPALLYAARRWGFVKILVALLAVEIVFSAGLAPGASRYLFVGRWFEWYLGMYAAEAVCATGAKSAPARLLTVLGMVAGLVATLFPNLWPFRDLLLSVGFVGLLLLCIRHEAPAHLKSRRGIAAPFARGMLAVGVSSYSLYLIHVPVIDLTWTACQLAAKYHLCSLATAKLIAPVSIVVALLLGYAWYRMFERPFLRSKPRTDAVAVNDQTEVPPVARAA